MFKDRVIQIKDIDYILLDTVVVDKTHYGIFARKKLLDKAISNEKVFVDYDIYEFENIDAGQDGDFDIKLNLIEEVNPEVYELIFEAKHLALQKLFEFKKESL